MYNKLYLNDLSSCVKENSTKWAEEPGDPFTIICLLRKIQYILKTTELANKDIRFFFCLFMLWVVVSAACQEQSWVMRQDGEEWRVPSDSGLNQSQQNRSNDESRTMEGDPLIVLPPSANFSLKTPWPNFNRPVHIVCNYVFACALWVGGCLVEYSSKRSTADVVPTHNNNKPRCKSTWKRQD